MENSFLLQGVSQDSHLAAIKHLLQIPQPEKVLISVGFMNEGGIQALEKELSNVVQETTVITGIRNGITSAQGLSRSLAIGCPTYVVDTGSRHVIFHPKVYLARNAQTARLIIGSANLTPGGLNSNIEASLFLEMTLANSESSTLISNLESKIDGMMSAYPEHVFRVTDDAMIRDLFESGRVVDESLRSRPTMAGSSRSRDLDTIPRMRLSTKPLARHRPESLSRNLESAPAPQPSTEADLASPVHESMDLVWQSNPLTRRALTIPTGETTNPTGSMLLGKGAWENVDHRHYFRDKVFADLNWQFDAAKETRHMERGEGLFQFVIRDISYGTFTLRISHNSLTNTRSYIQRNSMTQLHWGEARRIVAREDLLGRTLYLYRDRANAGRFVLEID